MKSALTRRIQIGDKIKEKPAIAYGERCYGGSLKP